MEEDSIEYEIKDEPVQINTVIKEVAEKGGVFKGTPSCPGCGPQLGLKIAMQFLDKTVLVTSSGCMSLALKALSVPCLNAGMDPLAAAYSVARFGHNVLCYAGDGALAANLGSLHAAAGRDDNILCICYNNQGYCNMNVPFKKNKEFARTLKATYVATASVSHLEDYINKIKKAASLGGFRFIDLLSPCPATLKFDSSNTLEVARLAVNTGLWPLYEVVDGDASFTERIRKPEPVERYFELLKVAISDDELEELQHTINKRWKALGNGYL